ncbi:MAG: SCO family protein [Dokdonella sp.]
MNISLRCLLFALIALFGIGAQALHAGSPPPTGTPSDSVYQLDAALTDQDGRALHFAEGRGKPRLVSMFYSTCPFMCPLIIDTIKKTEHALPESDRKQLEVLLVSFDAERDTPAVLKAMAGKRHIDTPRWTLAHASAADVRSIAAVLGIQYRQLQNREFSHSSVLVLLDAQGRIVARTEKLGEPDADFVAAVARVLGAR